MINANDIMPLVEFISAKLNQWVSYKNNEHLL